MAIRPYKPVIGITMGDPKGIGPEVVKKAISSKAIRKICRPVIFGDPDYFDYRKTKRLTARQCGQLAGFYIEQAAHAVTTGQIDAIATAPISKDHLREAGYPYPGHTEFLADLAGFKANSVRMMMAGPHLKVVLVTIHEPIRKIASTLNPSLIFETIRITDESLKKMFRMKRPRIAVAALNPHAGESGMFGDEEDKKIVPAIRMAQRKKINAQGPFPPDTVFYRALKGEFDVVVAMYHDQGLIPLKLLDFDQAVNVTLGLPFIRTSVDHGTAFEIAGKGIADPSSMIAAMELAAELAHK